MQRSRDTEQQRNFIHFSLYLCTSDSLHESFPAFQACFFGLRPYDILTAIICARSHLIKLDNRSSLYGNQHAHPPQITGVHRA